MKILILCRSCAECGRRRYTNQYRVDTGARES